MLKKMVKGGIHCGVILTALIGLWLTLFPSPLALHGNGMIHIAATLLPIVFFLGGAALAIWATERMLEGLVTLATQLRFSAFAVTAVLSGFEVENIAVGLVAASTGAAQVALGSVFGGSMFLVCVAVGASALFFPLQVQLPRSVLLLFAATPLVAGLGLIAPITPRWVGALLLLCFALAMIYLIWTSRHTTFLGSYELDKARKKLRPLWSGVVLTLLGLFVISIGGEYVTRGTQGIIVLLGAPALLMGMIVTPATVSLEEVVRQAIPSKRGRHDVGAGNLVGTLLYFLLFNFGFICLITPITVDPSVRTLDWPFLVATTWLVTLFLWHGRVGRRAGLLLLAIYAVYALLHI